MQRILTRYKHNECNKWNVGCSFESGIHKVYDKEGSCKYGPHHIGKYNARWFLNGVICDTIYSKTYRYLPTYMFLKCWRKHKKWKNARCGQADDYHRLHQLVKACNCFTRLYSDFQMNRIVFVTKFSDHIIHCIAIHNNLDIRCHLATKTQREHEQKIAQIIHNRYWKTFLARPTICGMIWYGIQMIYIYFFCLMIY